METESTDVQEDLNETNHEEVCNEHADENIETRNEKTRASHIIGGSMLPIDIIYPQFIQRQKCFKDYNENHTAKVSRSRYYKRLKI